jgi:phosphoribosylformylglycinamidine cyclo-ligase
MLRTFNCGVGMIAVVSPEEAEAVAAALASDGDEVVRLGTLVSDPEGPRTLFTGALGL